MMNLQNDHNFSVLAPNSGPSLLREPPDYFRDLHLDAIVDEILAGREASTLRPFFLTPAQDSGTIRYRQQVMRDLENPQLNEAVSRFCAGMQAMRSSLHAAESEQRYHSSQRGRFFLAAVMGYCDGVVALFGALTAARPESEGLRRLMGILSRYVTSPRFIMLRVEGAVLTRDLGRIAYCVRIRGNSVTVCNLNDEIDYGKEIARTFARFAGSEQPRREAERSLSAWLDRVETQVLERVVARNHAIFARLSKFRGDQVGFLDPTIQRFDQEVQFYLAYLAYIAPLKAAGLPFCYPNVRFCSGPTFVRDSFDLALAHSLAADGDVRVVCNDFTLSGDERLLVVTGPNQSGKTTLARCFGQIHHLAALGCAIPGCEASLEYFDRIFTHFEREENVAFQHGKLEDDLIRLHEILQAASERSIVILNEVFASTTLDDATWLSREVMQALHVAGARGVVVTFIDELSQLGPWTVSMVGVVAPETPSGRSFRFLRQPADGRAYAVELARMHGLSYAQLKDRAES